MALKYMHIVLGTQKKKRKKARPIIAKFVRYYDRKEVFFKKKHLKGKGISITESLTSLRMKTLEEAREKYGFKHVWTIDGRIIFKDGNDKPSVYYGYCIKHYVKKIHSFVCVIRAFICS